MKRIPSRTFLFFASSLLAIAAPAVARAADTVTPRPRSASLALVVGSNRGSALGRPSLHYADDDAVKYRETFRTLAERDEDVAVLTTFDKDTARLYPSLVDKVRAPTRDGVAAAAKALAARAAELQRAGREVDFYFVYAGHGDADKGAGFLDFEDGAFDATALATTLEGVGATRAHVILDSCNSFFMVNARKPGGQHFATAETAARSLEQRLPNVGVFLSTSSDGEVFEWSELASGIFSHAVRSGLLGGADADGDGAVTYGELAAFVNVATAEIKNPRFRPRVYSRGVRGRSDARIFDLSAAKGPRFRLGGDRQVRTTLRDGDDVPWVDLHQERGAAVTVVVPEAIASSAVAEELELGVAGPRVVSRHRLGSTDDVGGIASRGASDVFRLLFVRPFGPSALAAQEGDRDDAPVYGVKQADIERMRLMLAEAKELESSTRWVGAGGAAAAGAFSLGLGVFSLARPGDRDLGQSLAIAGAGSLLGGGLLASGLFRQPAETLQDDFERALAKHPEDAASLLSAAEFKLHRSAREVRHTRLILAGIGGAVTAFGTTGFVLNELHDVPNSRVRYQYALLVPLTAAATVWALYPTSLERLSERWAKDGATGTLPTSLRVGMAPLPGGAAAGISGSF